MIGSLKNKCSFGLETSKPEIEKLKVQLTFPRENFSFPRSDQAQRRLTVQIEEKKRSLEEKEEPESFSIEDILASCPTDTFFLPLKGHDQKSMK